MWETWGHINKSSIINCGFDALVLHLVELRPEDYGNVPEARLFSNNGLEIYKANSGVSNLPSSNPPVQEVTFEGQSDFEN